MKRWQVLTNGLFMVLPTMMSVDAADWRAGVAEVKITPDGPLMMAGYASRNRPADGKLTDLWAKALVVEDSDGKRAVLITVEVTNVSRDISTHVCRSLAERFGLERQAIMLCASHTHSGPAVGSWVCYTGTFTEEQHRWRRAYAAGLKQKLVGVAAEAVENLAPAELGCGQGRATFAVNRRNNREVDVPRLRAEGKLRGPVDHDVPVLFVHDDRDRLKAAVCGYACHAAVLSGYQWCGDWPGYAQIEVEKRHPGAVAMVWIGCGADQNPVPRRTVEYAEEYGRQIAQAVDEAHASAMRPIHGRLACSYAEIALPFAGIPTREVLQNRATSEDRFEATRAKRLLGMLQRDGQLSPTYSYPVQVWQLGDGPTFVALGGEVVVEYSLRLKQELGPGPVWIAGYSNDVMAYIPSRRVLREGGYEAGGAMVFAGLPSPWATGIEETIVREVHRQVELVRQQDRSPSSR